MPKELFNRLFANLPEVLKLHVEYNQIMKTRVKSSGFPIGNVSDILSDMVCIILLWHANKKLYNILVLSLVYLFICHTFSLMVQMVID